MKVQRRRDFPLYFLGWWFFYVGVVRDLGVGWDGYECHLMY